MAKKTKVKKTKDGKVDLRTKEGQAIAKRMAKARRVKKKKESSLVGKIKKIFK